MPPTTRSEIIEGLRRGCLIGMALLALVMPLPRGAAVPLPQAERPVRLAAFGDVTPQPDVALLADWVVDAQDNHALPFAILDKRDARVYVFEPSGRLLGASPVLLGLNLGDDAVEGIGSRKLEDIPPDERTTHAGRFVAEPGHNLRGENVVWIDYKAALSMHRVLTTHPEERRLERLATPTPDDNRISYGCVNVPVAFFERTLAPAFDHTYGVVYVLPETRPLREVFPVYDARARQTAQRLAQGPR